MKLEDAKELQNIFKSNRRKISKERFKPKKQVCALENIKLLYYCDKLLLNYLLIIIQLHLI